MEIPRPEDKYNDIIVGGNDFEEQARVDISDGSEATIAFGANFSSAFTGVLGQPDSQIRFKWSNVEGVDISNDNSLKLPADELFEFIFPYGMWRRKGGTAYLHLKQVDAVSLKYFRYALI